MCFVISALRFIVVQKRNMEAKSETAATGVAELETEAVVLVDRQQAVEREIALIQKLHRAGAQVKTT